MATLISCASGNFTTSTTWALVDSTSLLDSEANSTASTTSYVYSSTFTPGAITVDGIAVKIASRTSSVTGTVSIELFNNTDTVSVASLTINSSDIPVTGGATYNRGWIFFKFGSPQLLIAGKAYKVGFKTSVTGEVTLYRDATAGNWSRLLRTTTTQAAVAGDQLHIMGEFTAAATFNTITVTMDNTATTSFGSTSFTQSITVNDNSVLTWGVTAATNYYLKWKGIFAIFDGGTVNVGTSGSRMPSSSTAVLEMDSTVNVDSGISTFYGSTFNAYGAARTNAYTLLTADKSSTATVLSVGSTTDWANSDTIAIASTTRTSSQCESKTISTVDSSTQVTLTAGLTNAHSGSAPIQAEVINLTRNVKIRGISTSLQGYIVVNNPVSTFNANGVEFYQLGSATSSKRGIDIGTGTLSATSGTCNIQYCSIHDFTVASSLGINLTSSSSSPPDNITISNNSFYNNNLQHFSMTASNILPTIENNVFMLNASTTTSMMQITTNCKFNNNRIIGSNNSTASSFGGLNVIFSSNNAYTKQTETWSNNVVHSNALTGVVLSGVFGITFDGWDIWRNGDRGVGFGSAFSNANLAFTNCNFFGNANSNIATDIASTSAWAIANIKFYNCTFSGDSTFSTTNGFRLSQSSLGSGISLSKITFDTCLFSPTTGIKAAHTNDFNFTTLNSLQPYIDIRLINTKLDAATEILNQSSIHTDSTISSQKHDQIVGNHKTWRKEGTITIDTSIFDDSPSLRMTPNGTGNLESRGYAGGFYIPVNSGQSISPSVKIRKSSLADGVAYVGSQPRLLVKQNNALGVSADTYIATGSNASSGAWETIQGTTPIATDDGAFELAVDCSGFVGWVNIDTWSL